MLLMTPRRAGGLLPGDDGDLGAAAGGGLRRRQADAGRAAQDDDPLTMQIHDALPFCCAGAHVFHGAVPECLPSKTCWRACHTVEVSGMGGAHG